MCRNSRLRLLTAAYLVLASLAGVANASAIISVVPGSQTVSDGATFTVELDVTGVSDIYGYQFDLSFDPNVLQAVSSSEGSLLPSAGPTFFVPGTPDNSNGVVEATADTLTGPGPGVGGSGSLAFFTFQAIGTGSSALSVGNALLLDSNLNSIESSTTDGAITVAPVPLPAAVWLLLSSLGGLGAFLRAEPHDIA